MKKGDKSTTMSTQQKCPVTQRLRYRSTPGSERTFWESLQRCFSQATQAQILETSWEEVTAKQVREIREALSETWSARTADASWRVLRAVLRQAMDYGRLDSEEWDVIKTFRGLAEHLTDEPAVYRFIEVEDFKALIYRCWESAHAHPEHSAGRYRALRDAAIIATLYYNGSRVTESLNLRMVDIDLAPNVRLAFNRRVKGGVKYVTYPNEEYLMFLAPWLEVRGTAEGTLLCKSPNTPEQVMTRQAVDLMLKNVCKDAGVEKLSAHDFRGSRVTRLLDEVSPLEAGGAVGHRSERSTLRYDRKYHQRRIKVREHDAIFGETEVSLAPYKHFKTVLAPEAAQGTKMPNTGTSGSKDKKTLKTLKSQKGCTSLTKTQDKRSN